MSQRVMTQGILYSVALFSLFIAFILLNAIAINVIESSYAVEYISSILYPLQGFWNALIYMTPQFRRMVRKRHEIQENISLFCSRLMRREKAQGNDSNLIHDDQRNTSRNWLTRLRMIILQIRKSKELDKSSNRSDQVKAECECEEEKVSEESNNQVGILTQQKHHSDHKIAAISKQEEDKGEYEATVGNLKGEDSNILTVSGIIPVLSIQEVEVVKSSNLSLSQDSGLKEENEPDLVEHSLTLEVNVDVSDNISNEGSDDETSYVDDYLRMIEIDSKASSS